MWVRGDNPGKLETKQWAHIADLKVNHFQEEESGGKHWWKYEKKPFHFLIDVKMCGIS